MLCIQGLKVERQLSVPVTDNSIAVREPLFIDILLQGDVIIEVKALEKLHPIHEVQLLTYVIYG